MTGRRPISKRLRYEILRRDNHQCRYCGATAPDTPLTVDHVLPVALGGTNDATNLVAACRDCNSGKTSSAPDAPLVDQVSEDATRWNLAMQVVLDRRAADRATRRKDHQAFLTSWQRWTYGSDNKHFELEADWRTTIDRFIASGLDHDDLDEMVDVAMESKSRSPWRYFCGCCWRLIEQIQRDVSAEINREDAGPESEIIATAWTVLDYYNELHRIEADIGQSLPTTVCNHSDAGECRDPVCVLQHAAAIDVLIAKARQEGEHRG